MLDFINTDDKFSLDRLYGRVSQTGEFTDIHIWSGKLITYLDLHEARAILLGRLGRHDQALEAYVYRLQDFKKAEEWVPYTI